MTDSLLRRAQHSLTPAQRRDLDALTALCETDPVTTVVPAMHLEAARASGVMPAGLWVIRRRHGWGRELAGLVWSGANLCAVVAPTGDQDADEALRADLAAAAIGRLARPAAIVGEADLTLDLWGRVEPWWGPAREVRPRQVSMVADAPAPHAAPVDAADLALDAVRRARDEDYEALLPACVHMFIGEVGYDPMRHGRAAYEERLHHLVRAGRAYLQYGTVHGRREVVFKAEVGALGGGVAQLQGVWVHPDLRGRGLARAGLAAVISAVRVEHAPTVSLYVNDFNAPALAAYEAVGFRCVGTFATVMF
ncbi:GNAT family N-acetyltransferase [Demequina activiva]|uniref:Acetyltransferase n=1 Tax=Demequina activiva TaxID=1582364 RepID=A0A919Q240_9MICO|nr:GNAT family N-acetyltransferase [Demequina activiva]GIG54209.1 acetyltransferase [Demequina activiva]